MNLNSSIYLSLIKKHMLQKFGIDTQFHSVSDLRSHRFNHNFNCKSPMCSCNLKDEEDNSHYFLRCPHFHHIRINLLSNISRIIGSDISILPWDRLTNIILYESNVYNKIPNNLILIETLEYIRKSERFSVIEAFP